MKQEETDEKMDIWNKGFLAGEEHSKPSKETIAQFEIMNDRFQLFEEKLDGMSVKLDTIYPDVIESMSEKEFYRRLWSKAKEGGGLIKWTVTVIVAFLILSGYAKSAILSWLAIKS